MEQEKQTGVFKGKTKETIEGQKKEKSWMKKNGREKMGDI
jgi:hypothetical protein